MQLFDTLAARQRYEDMLREAEESRRARRLGGESAARLWFNRMAQRLTDIRLPRNGQPDKAATRPEPA